MSDIVFDVAIGFFVIFVGGSLIRGMYYGDDQNAREGVAVRTGTVGGTRRVNRKVLSRRKK